MEYVKSIHNLVFPSKNWCYFCRDHTIYIDSFICDECREHLEILNKEIHLDTTDIESVFYILGFNRFIKAMVYDYKFNGKSYLYRPLGQIMVNSINNLHLDQGIDIIYFIPSHRRKEAIRGYNQSELLAKYIGKILNIQVSTNNLIKYRFTSEQNKLDRFQRLNNLTDSFKLKRPEEVMGKTVLLIDDIVTTGSTIMECAKVLKENGAKQITALALTSSKKY